MQVIKAQKTRFPAFRKMLALNTFVTETEYSALSPAGVASGGAYAVCAVAGSRSAAQALLDEMRYPDEAQLCARAAICRPDAAAREHALDNAKKAKWPRRRKPPSLPPLFACVVITELFCVVPGVHADVLDALLQNIAQELYDAGVDAADIIVAEAGEAAAGADIDEWGTLLCDRGFAEIGGAWALSA